MLEEGCSHSNFGVLLVKKTYSEREQATSNCTGDRRYGKKALSPKRLRAVKEAIASVQLPQPGQKDRLVEDIRTKVPLTQAAAASHVGKGYDPIYFSLM